MELRNILENLRGAAKVLKVYRGAAKMFEISYGCQNYGTTAVIVDNSLRNHSHRNCTSQPTSKSPSYQGGRRKELGIVIYTTTAMCTGSA